MIFYVKILWLKPITKYQIETLLRTWSLQVLRPYFQTSETSKRMIGKGPSWLHSLCLIEVFPDLTNFLEFHSQGASQQQFF
jgi:hypothetical protein